MIELAKPKYGTRCNDCFSDEDVKEIILHSDGQGVAIRLCAKCRGELIQLLLDDNKKDGEQEALLHIDKEWETVEMPKEKGDYLVTVYDDSAGENIVLHCRWDDLPVGTEPRFWYGKEDITDYVIAWVKYPEAYDKTHNPILSDSEDAWVSQHM